MKFLINVQLIFLLANRPKYFSSRNKWSDYWYKWLLRSPFIMRHFQPKFLISKKGETLKLLSLDFYHALLPSFSGAEACGWQTWKEESRKESKLAFMGDAKCARLHIRHCMSTYLIPVVAFRSRNQHPHFTAKQTELCWCWEVQGHAASKGKELVSNC